MTQNPGGEPNPYPAGPPASGPWPQYSEQPQSYPQPQGQYQQPQGQYQYAQPANQIYAPQVHIRPSNGLGTAGFVCGLLGLILFWIPFVGLILGILGVVMGGAGIAAGNKNGSGTGLAVAGLVLGLISLIPAIIVIAALSSV